MTTTYRVLRDDGERRAVVVYTHGPRRTEYDTDDNGATWHTFNHKTGTRSPVASGLLQGALSIQLDRHRGGTGYSR